MAFEFPARLVLIPLGLLALLAIRRRWPRQSPPALTVPHADLFVDLPRTWRERMHRLPAALRISAAVLAGIGLAGPFAVRERVVDRQVGLDVLIALDVSRSMAAEDFQPNRLEAARAAAERIVARRPHDRFGIITFANDVQMNSPLTADHAAIVATLRQLSANGRAGGTVLGDAIAHATNGLRGTGSMRRVLLVFSDGASNGGRFDPVVAASLASQLGIRVHAAAIGSENPAPFPTPFGRVHVPIPFDAALLAKVAAAGSGRMIPITDDRGFDLLVDELERLEPSRVIGERRHATIDLTYLFAALATACACADLILAASILARFP